MVDFPWELLVVGYRAGQIPQQAGPSCYTILFLMITPTQVEDIFEVESCCLTQVGFNLRIPQPLPHKFWDYEQILQLSKITNRSKYSFDDENISDS